MIRRSSLAKLFISTLIIFCLLLPLVVPQLNVSIIIVLLLSLLCYCVSHSSRTGLYIYNNKSFTLTINHLALNTMFFVFMLYIIELFFNRSIGFTHFSVVYLTIFFPVISVFLFLRISYIKHFVAQTVCWYMMIFIGLNIMAVLINGLQTGRTSLLGMFSTNYASAMLYLGIPLLLSNINNMLITKAERFWNILTILLAIVVFIISGSRTAIGASIIIISIELLRRKRKNTHYRRFLLVVLVFLILFGFIYMLSANSILLPEPIRRGLSVLNGTREVSEDIRTLIWTETLNSIKNTNIALGNGDNTIIFYGTSIPSHNLLFETILTCGLFGAIILVIFFLHFFRACYRNAKKENHIYILMEIGLFLLTAMFHPFFSTSVNCTILMCISLLTISQEQ